MLSCGNYGADLIFANSGNYVCPRCHSVIKYNERDRSTGTIATTDTSAVEVNIPAEHAYFKHAGALVATHGLKAGLPTAKAKELIDAFAATLVKMKSVCADPQKANSNFNILAVVSHHKLRVQIYTVGLQSQSSAFADLAGFDDVTVTALSSGTLLSLVKNIGE
jgi:hypothetical protein